LLRFVEHPHRNPGGGTGQGAAKRPVPHGQKRNAWPQRQAEASSDALEWPHTEDGFEMSLFGTLQTAVSGFAAQSSAMGAIGDNIANASTTGYKQAGVEFETMLGNQTPGSYQSGGVRSAIRYAVADQGQISSTSSITDLAINGNGFFVVQTPGGGKALTRAGSFVPDSNGDLINAAGYKLQGYSLQDGSTDSGSGSLVSVNIGGESLLATPSTSGTLTVNLPSSATAVSAANLPSTNSAAASQYTDKTSLVAYDNLGAAVNIDIYMTKMGPNSWEVDTFNAAGAAANGGFPYSAGAMSTTTLTFDPTTGKLASGSASSISAPIPNGNTIKIDMSSTTQLATDYGVTSGTIDGNAPSKVSSVSIATDGTLSAVYANGARRAMYKIPLANVNSPDNMSVNSGNIYEPNSESGAMVLGAANSGSLGSIDSSALENSTVDLATELSSMIATQQAYGANAKVLTTTTQMLQTLMTSIT
jgi:flagellar hook protein FlgE